LVDANLRDELPALIYMNCGQFGDDVHGDLPKRRSRRDRWRGSSCRRGCPGWCWTRNDPDGVTEMADVVSQIGLSHLAKRMVLVGGVDDPLNVVQAGPRVLGYRGTQDHVRHAVPLGTLDSL